MQIKEKYLNLLLIFKIAYLGSHNVAKVLPHYQVPSSPHQMASSGVMLSPQVYMTAANFIHHNPASFQSSQIANHYPSAFTGVTSTQSSGQWVLQQQQQQQGVIFILK